MKLSWAEIHVFHAQLLAKQHVLRGVYTCYFLLYYILRYYIIERTYKMNMYRFLRHDQ